MVSEQMASEVTRLQEVVSAHAKENHDLKVEIRALK